MLFILIVLVHILNFVKGEKIVNFKPKFLPKNVEVSAGSDMSSFADGGLASSASLSTTVSDENGIISTGQTFGTATGPNSGYNANAYGNGNASKGSKYGEIHGASSASGATGNDPLGIVTSGSNFLVISKPGSNPSTYGTIQNFGSAVGQAQYSANSGYIAKSGDANKAYEATGSAGTSGKSGLGSNAISSNSVVSGSDKDKSFGTDTITGSANGDGEYGSGTNYSANEVSKDKDKSKDNDKGKDGSKDNDKGKDRSKNDDKGKDKSKSSGKRD